MAVVTDMLSSILSLVKWQARNSGRRIGEWKDIDEKYIRNLYGLQMRITAGIGSEMARCRELQRKQKRDGANGIQKPA